MNTSSTSKRPIFTKKHYEALVSLVWGMSDKHLHFMCEFFAKDNENFNASRFMLEVRAVREQHNLEGFSLHELNHLAEGFGKENDNA